MCVTPMTPTLATLQWQIQLLTVEREKAGGLLADLQPLSTPRCYLTDQELALPCTHECV